MTLRPLVEDPASREEEIRRALERLDRAETELRAEEARAQKEIRAALTPRQQAQFVLFQERFRAEIRERVRRFRDGGEPGAPRPRGRR